ncbi:hypothetical protein CC78DRAFT_426092, partial [Lojkania enalia]
EVQETKSKKRKRETLPDEIEIDINLPEPASKKAARKAKKANVKPTPNETTSEAEAPLTNNKPNAGRQDGDKKENATQRSDFGVWVGNLPWSATRDSLRMFMTEHSDIANDHITRVHMPAPTKLPNSNWTTKPLNKGFAYVDFSTELAMYSAIALTETKMDGRPLLIKNAKNFEGRPEKAKSEDMWGKEKNEKGGNPPNKRIFVGNLSFDVTKDDLLTHFGQCGEVAGIHMATFEDSGKCKGYGWVTFGDIEAASSAVKGYVYKEDAKKNRKEDLDDEQEKKGKKWKWYLNKLMGRELRCEFAEDPTVRYNKRYGKDKKEDMAGVHPDRQRHFDEDDVPTRSASRSKRQQRSKIDPRMIKSGAAHTDAPRASQAIVESRGKKITFD